MTHLTFSLKIPFAILTSINSFIYSGCTLHSGHLALNLAAGPKISLLGTTYKLTVDKGRRREDARRPRMSCFALKLFICRMGWQKVRNGRKVRRGGRHECAGQAVKLYRHRQVKMLRCPSVKTRQVYRQRKLN